MALNGPLSGAHAQALVKSIISQSHDNNYWDFPAPSLSFTGNDLKKRKYAVSGSSG